MTIFAQEGIREGDVALFLRKDGRFEIASAISPALAMSEEARRLEQHMAIIVGLFMATQDDATYKRFAELGQTDEAQRLLAANLPPMH